MASNIRIKHRAAGGGGTGSPTTIDPSGSLSINFDTGAATPEFWGSDGTNWKRLNPVAAAPTVGTTSLPGGTTGSATGIGSAWTALAVKPTDPIIIASFAGNAYVKTGAGGSDSDWTSLGSSTSFASVAEVIAGIDTAKAINSATLRGAAPNASTGATDKDKLVRTDAAGKIDNSFLDTSVGGSAVDAGKIALLDASGHVPATAIDAINAPTGGGAAVAGDAGKFIVLDAAGQVDGKFIGLKAVAFKGTIDLTATPPTTWNSGDYGIAAANVASGSLDAGFSGAGIAVDVKKGDMIIKTAAGWEALAQDIDLSSYVTKSGANPIAADMAMTWTAPVTMTAIIDGADASKSKIDNVTVDCGTF